MIRWLRCFAAYKGWHFWCNTFCAIFTPIYIYFLKTFYVIKQLSRCEAELFQYVEMQQKTLAKINQANKSHFSVRVCAHSNMKIHSRLFSCEILDTSYVKFSICMWAGERNHGWEIKRADQWWLGCDSTCSLICFHVPLFCLVKCYISRMALGMRTFWRETVLEVQEKLIKKRNIQELV